jgi:oligopeptide/dipeptide ABC transporter ATP-binding protein
MGTPLLDLEDLTVQYQLEDRWLTAVSNASFEIEQGEFFGLIGESGCGKSTLARALLGGLDDNGRIVSGTIRFDGTEIQNYSDSKFSSAIRMKNIAWIPQGSMNSLDPLMRVEEQAAKLAKTHTNLSAKEAKRRFHEMLDVIGIDEDRAADYPHQFSGGMQQRVLIALSLFLEPPLVICDEPTTALDVIMQDQIFDHLEEIQSETGISVLLITHDISVVFETCDRLATMHAGQLVETGTVQDVFEAPHHPYSILLQEAFPDVRYPDRQLEVIDGIPPKTFDEVDYCTFVDRCPWAVEECRQRAPDLEPVSGTGSESDQLVACVRKDEVLDLYCDEHPVPGETNVHDE